MKKRDAILLVGALGCLYFILSFSLVFEIDQLGTREQLRLRRARKAEQDERHQVSWIQEFFQRKCRCPGSRSRHSMRGESSAHALAIHATFDKETCTISEETTRWHDVDLQVSDLLREARLSYPRYLYHHTGWIQQMEVSYSVKQWEEESLRVFFVLHSHNDPGWQHTYSGCYSMWTVTILNRAVEYLERDRVLKFIWAEVIYLKKWYEEAPAAKKKALSRLIRNGQFEVVTGGLVMSDEATSHYHAMLDQLIEGHQWLAKTLNVFPKHGWAIDPFGHSSTMTYLLKRSGLESTVIQRIHYALKQHLAYRKELEFIWKQNWDNGESDTGMMCHTMPFLNYNILYSCGPDIQICCQLDFHSRKCWAWGKYQQPEPITEENIKAKSEALLDQLRKKAQFYKHNVLLVPHGDDFRYTSDEEWKKQTENLKKLFAYMNSRPDMKVKLEFGTLADYFSAVNERQGPPDNSRFTFPSLSGDFFTYTDREDQYWSGYFTSRPFLKGLIRKLQSRLRASEILYTLSQAYSMRRSRRITADHITPLYRHLVDARSTLGLLQHHDAVTGTARKIVVSDYIERANAALDDTKTVLTHMTSALLQLSLSSDIDHDNFTPTIVDMFEGPLPIPMSLDHREKDIRKLRHTLLVYNSLGVVRNDVVSVTVPNYDVRVIDVDGEAVRCQIDPVWDMPTASSEQVFMLHFEVNVPPLGIAQYHIYPTDPGQGCPRANITIFNGKPALHDRTIFHSRHHSVLDRPRSIENTAVLVTICACTGLLKAFTTKMDGVEHQSEIRIVTYGTGSWSNPYRDKSGAYIFMPDGSAQELKYDNPIVVVTRGPLVSTVTTHIPLMSQKITLFDVNGPAASGLHIENQVNITGEKNLELAMRLISDINNLDSSFHTDLNGYQMSQRFTQSRLPLQGNFYPVTTAAFIQDDLFRATILSAQSHGVSGLHPGWLEFILDRKLEQDDWRGLSEGVQDNVPVTSRFQLLWESRKPTFHKNNQEGDVKSEPSMEFLSLLGHLSSQMLNNPLITMSLQGKFALSLTPAAFEALNQPLPCDIFLVNLRSMGTSSTDTQALLILHRLVSDCDFPESYLKCDAAGGKVKWTELLSQVSVSQVEETSLTGTQVSRTIHHSFLIVHPMEIITFKIILH